MICIINIGDDLDCGLKICYVLTLTSLVDIEKVVKGKIKAEPIKVTKTKIIQSVSISYDGTKFTHKVVQRSKGKVNEMENFRPYIKYTFLNLVCI